MSVEVFGSPQWLSMREQQWLQYCDDTIGALSKKNLAFVKPMFFEEYFDYGNEKKYGKFAKEYEMAFLLSPVYTEEHWRRWFVEYLPTWLGAEYLGDVSKFIRPYMFRSPNSKWEVNTQVKFFKFCFGDQAQPGPYQFLNYGLQCHPYLSDGGRCAHLYSYWLSRIYCWLFFIDKDADCLEAHTLDMWLSVVDYMHPIFFKNVDNQDTLAEQRDLFEFFRLVRQGFTVESVVKQSRVDPDEAQAVIARDAGKRQQFVDMFKQAIEGRTFTGDIKKAWDLVGEPDFIFEWDKDSPNTLRGEARVSTRDVYVWTDKILAQLR